MKNADAAFHTQSQCAIIPFPPPILVVCHCHFWFFFSFACVLSYLCVHSEQAKELIIRIRYVNGTVKWKKESNESTHKQTHFLCKYFFFAFFALFPSYLELFLCRFTAKCGILKYSCCSIRRCHRLREASCYRNRKRKNYVDDLCCKGMNGFVRKCNSFGRQDKVAATCEQCLLVAKMQTESIACQNLHNGRIRSANWLHKLKR